MTDPWGLPSSFNQSSVMTTCFIYSGLNTHTQKLSQIVSKVSSNSVAVFLSNFWLRILHFRSIHTETCGSRSP